MKWIFSVSNPPALPPREAQRHSFGGQATFIHRFLAWALWIAFVGLSSCYKEFSENYGEEEIIIENAAIGVHEADDALDAAYQAEVIQKIAAGGRIAVTSCGLIYDDAINKILTINFGDTTCLGLFGRTRHGKIFVNYYTHLLDSLSDRTITFENYIVNGKKVEGTVFLHDISFTDTLQVATRTLVDFSVAFPNGTAITFNGSHNRSWTSGRADSIANNNVYTFTGSMSGVSSGGRSFTQDIVTPVRTNFYCASLGYFARSEGVVELSELEGYPNRKRTVDYGNGICNNTISVETFRRAYGVSAD